MEAVGEVKRIAHRVGAKVGTWLARQKKAQAINRLGFVFGGEGVPRTPQPTTTNQPHRDNPKALFMQHKCWAF